MLRNPKKTEKAGPTRKVARTGRFRFSRLEQRIAPAGLGCARGRKENSGRC